MQKPLAPILWEAANKYLSPTAFADSLYQSHYSCDAVDSAAHGVSVWGSEEYLHALGLPYGNGFNQFRQYAEGEERQGARYMWLLLAMHMAENEQAMVEVV